MYKLIDLYVYNQNTYLKTSFIPVKDLNKSIILGTPFLNMIKPFQVNDSRITSNILEKPLEFRFIDIEFYKDLDLIKTLIVNQITNEQNQLKFLKEEIQFKHIENQLQNPQTSKEI